MLTSSCCNCILGLIFGIYHQRLWSLSRLESGASHRYRTSPSLCCPCCSFCCFCCSRLFLCRVKRRNVTLVSFVRNMCARRHCQREFRAAFVECVTCWLRSGASGFLSSAECQKNRKERGLEAAIQTEKNLTAAVTLFCRGKGSQSVAHTVNQQPPSVSSFLHLSMKVVHHIIHATQFELFLLFSLPELTPTPVYGVMFLSDLPQCLPIRV